jgi:uncharacterized membrane protein
LKLHPVHMMVVHFPAALLPMDFIFGIAAGYFDQERLYDAAYYSLMGGVIGGWIAVLAGLYDLFAQLIVPASAALKKGIVHGIVQTLMITGFTIVLATEYHHPDYIYNVPTALWIVKSILIFVLLTGNYLGGDLVLRYVSKRFQSSESA